MIGNKVTIADGFKFLIVATLALGLFFRFANLEKKVYWGDEVYSSLRIAGYTLKEATQELFDGKPKSIEELQQYQKPRSDKNITDTVKALAIEDSQHPPLYYIMARLWEQCFGSSVKVKRMFPAIVSLLVFPCLYCLCLELFNSPTVGWVAVAMVAVSPFHVLYAQEVREYGLWTVTVLLSSWLLLRSIRIDTKFSWAIYASTLPLLLYTYLLSVLIAIGHGIYVFGIADNGKNKTQTAFMLSTIFGFLTFAPWLFVVVNNLFVIQSTTSLFEEKVPLLSLFQTWGFNLCRAFIDLDSQGRIVGDRSAIAFIIRYISIATLTAVVSYSIYFICRKSPKRIWLFILSLMGVTGITLILPDLILGGIRSSITRYLVPCYLGIQLAVAYTIFTICCQEIVPKFHLERRYLWRTIALALFTGSVLSCSVSTRAESWWNKYGSYYNPQIAAIINQCPSPLAIGSGYVPRILSLSYLLQPKAQIQFANEANLSQIPDGYSNVFLYRPSEQLKYRLKSGQRKRSNYKIETVYRSPPVYDYLEPIARHSEIWLSEIVKQPKKGARG